MLEPLAKIPAQSPPPGVAASPHGALLALDLGTHMGWALRSRLVRHHIGHEPLQARTFRRRGHGFRALRRMA